MEPANELQKLPVDSGDSGQTPVASPQEPQPAEKPRTGLHFTYQMPFWDRIDLLFVSLIAFVIGAIAVAAGLFLLWGLIATW